MSEALPATRWRLVGVELYYDDLAAAKRFYVDVLGLQLAEEKPGHYVHFAAGDAFFCAELKGLDSYPSENKAVLFFEVPDLRAVVEAIGRSRFLQYDSEESPERPPWAVLHDPEGYNVILIQARPA